MKKTMYLLMSSLLFAGALSAQTIKANIGKAISDPDREKNSAKADVKLHSKHKIRPDSTINTATKTVARKKKSKKSS